MHSLSRAARIASLLALSSLVKAEDVSNGFSKRDAVAPFFPALGSPPSRLMPRQNNNGGCPDQTHSCASINYPGFCCINSARCTTDDNNHIACCPNGIFCVGTVTTEPDDGTCRSGYYSCPQDLFENGCCLSGYEYCSKGRCVNADDAIVALVAAVPGFVTSAGQDGVAVYRTVTNTAGAVVTSLVGDAGEVYSRYIENPAGAVSSWVGSAVSDISTAITGFPIPTVDPSDIASEYGDFRSDLGGWYSSFTSRHGESYTSFLNEAGQYVTSIQTEVNGVVTQTAVTVQFPQFVQAEPTGNAGISMRSVQRTLVGGETLGARGTTIFLWVWALGLGLFTATIGWL